LITRKRLLVHSLVRLLCGAVFLAPDAAGQKIGLSDAAADYAKLDFRVIKNAPYTAVAVVETLQTLADGSHIRQRSEMKLARDAEGRTRREQTLDSIGPWKVGPKGPHLIFLYDPIAQVSYVIDMDKKVAQETSTGPGAGATQKIPPDQAPPPDPAAVAAKLRALQAQNAGKTIERLPNQLIEGINAEGTRTIQQLPPNTVGNDRPLTIQTEVWYSTELQIVLMSKRQDPRLGETTYRLTNIRRTSPPASLFSVPKGIRIIQQPIPLTIKEQPDR